MKVLALIFLIVHTGRSGDIAISCRGILHARRSVSRRHRGGTETYTDKYGRTKAGGHDIDVFGEETAHESSKPVEGELQEFSFGE